MELRRPSPAQLQYASGAIIALKAQLASCNSVRKRAKLESRIRFWEQVKTWGLDAVEAIVKEQME